MDSKTHEDNLEETIQVRKGKQHFEGLYTSETPIRFFDVLGE